MSTGAKILILAVFTTVILNLPVLSVTSNLDVIDNTESQLFNHNYTNENPYKRLERIENEIYGRTFQDDLNKRINRIASYSGNVTQPTPTSTKATTPKDNSITDYPAVTELEKQVFHKKFSNLSLDSRLNNLEQNVLGSIFPNDALCDRVDRLRSALGKNKIDNSANNDESIRIVSFEEDSQSLNQLSYLENQQFGKTFSNNTVTTRLERLETQLFGSTQQGSVEERISRLTSATGYSANNFSNSSNDPMTIYRNFSTEITDDDMNTNYTASNQPQMQTSTGLFDILQSIAMPIVSNLLTTGKAFPRPQNPYPYYYDPQYGNYGNYYGYNNYYPNYTYYPNNGQSGIYNLGTTQSMNGMGVQILR